MVDYRRRAPYMQHQHESLPEFLQFRPLQPGEMCAKQFCRKMSPYSMVCYHCRRVFHPNCAGLPNADFRTFHCLDCFLKVDEEEAPVGGRGAATSGNEQPAAGGSRASSAVRARQSTSSSEEAVKTELRWQYKVSPISEEEDEDDDYDDED